MTKRTKFKQKKKVLHRLEQQAKWFFEVYYVSLVKDSIRSFLARVGRPMWTVRSGVAREAQAMKK